jgi:hypothetical protein
LRQAALVYLRANEGTGRFVGHFNVDQGEVFELAADVAPQWIIEDVETTPAGLVADWSQQPVRGSSGKLTIRLNTPLKAEQNLSLTISARRRSAPWGEILHPDDLEILDFANAAVQQRLIQVRAAETYQLQVRGANHLARLDPAQLAAQDAALLDEKPSGLIFVNDENAQNLSVSISAKAPQYTAEIKSESLVGDDRLVESYRFLITPQGREVGRFRVRFSQPRSTPITWSLADDPAANLVARRLAENEGSFPTWPGDVWEIVLPNPRATPFTLLASRSTPLTDDMPLALASVLDAETQQGTIQISSAARSTPVVHSRRLKSIPVTPAPSDQYSSAFCAFRYDPEEDTLLTAEPPLVLASQADADIPSQAWIWQATLLSRYNRNGVENSLTCHVENVGLEKFQFQLGEGEEIQAATIDGQPLNEIAADPQHCIVTLPAGHRFCTIVLSWTNRQASPGVLAACPAPWPTVDIPILSRQWMVSIPPGMELADVQVGSSRLANSTWPQRLFGSLARVHDWQSFLQSRQVAQTAPDNPDTTMKQSTGAQPEPTEKSAGHPAGLESPWSTNPHDTFSPASGWSCYLFDSSGSGDRAWIANRQSMWSWTWSVFVIAAALRWWLGNRAMAFEIAILGSATLLALLVPTPWVHFTAALWLGLVTGWLLVCITAWSQSRRGESPMADSRRAESSLVTTVLLVVAGFALADYALADTDVPANSHREIAQSKAKIERVLVPVDQKGKPTGGLYYLSEKFHDELLQATSDSTTAIDYLILRATYMSRAAKGAKQPESADQLDASYVIETLSDNAVVRLPLGFDGAALVPGSVELDGHPATFERDNQNKELLVSLKKRGNHQLKLLLHLPRGSAGESLSIPRVSNAQIDCTDINREKLFLPLYYPELTGNLPRFIADSHAELGQVDRVELRSGEPVSPTNQPVFDTHELYWAKVKPDSVTIDARFHIDVHSGSVRQIYLQAPPHWQPTARQQVINPQTASKENATAESPAALAANKENTPAAKSAAIPDAIGIDVIRPLPGNANVWEIDLAQPVSGTGTVEISFQLEDARGLGHFRPLHWQVLGAKSVQNNWAAAVDPSLQFEILPASVLSKSNKSFEELWPTGDERPQLTWRSPAGNDSITIATTPKEPNLTANYQLAAIAGQDEWIMRLAANLNIRDGKVFQFRLRVPPEFEVETASVQKIQNQSDVPCRWARSRPDLLTIFLATPLSGPCNLLVTGRVPMPTKPEFTLPQFSVEGAAANGSCALILRQPEVLLDVKDSAGMQKLSESQFADPIAKARRAGILLTPDATKTPAIESGKLTAVLQGPEGLQPATIHVEQNQPQLRAVQVITLNRKSDSWLATLNADLQIESGVVDELRLDLPLNWIGPFETSPKVPLAVEEIGGESRRQLVLHFAAPLERNLRLQISGPLTIPPGQRASAPDVRFLGAIRQTRFLLLPRRLENQQLAWDTRGLVPRSLPDILATIIPDSEAYRAYQLVGDRCRADLRSIESNNEKAQVRLVDVDWAANSNRDYWGVAALDIDPAGTTVCELQLPESEHLVAAQLDSSPAQLTSLGENHWNVWLGDNKLPRHLELIFTGRNVDVGGKRLQLTAPTLVDLPVERSLWRLSTPEELDQTPPAESSLSALQYFRLRAENMAAALEAASGQLLDESTDDVARWYTPWLRRFAACRTDLLTAKSNPSLAAQLQDVDAQLRSIDQQRSALATKLKVPEPDALDASTVSDWVHLAALVHPPHHRDLLRVTRGSNPLVTESSSFWNSDSWARFWGALGVALLTVGLLLAIRSRWLSNQPLLPQPHWLGLAIGLIWSLWLTPAVIGIAILAVSSYYLWKLRGIQISSAVSR